MIVIRIATTPSLKASRRPLLMGSVPVESWSPTRTAAPTATSADLPLKSLRKPAAAHQGVGHPPVVIGDLARHAWGSKRDPESIQLLVPSGEAHRGAIL